MKIIRVLFLIVGGLVAVGCSNTVEFSQELPSVMPKELAEYKLGIGDQLSINVWRNQELTLNVPVRPDGKFSMPLIGEVDAVDRTASELSEALRVSLEKYIRNPQVTVIVTSTESSDFQRRVRLTGAVEGPLSAPYRMGMTVLDIVLQGGGLTEFALANKAVLYRKTESGVKAYPVKLDDILFKGRLETNYELAPSDILTVPERSF